MDDPACYLAGIPLDLDPNTLRNWGFNIAVAEAIGKCVREMDHYALDRWATDGGAP